MVYRCSDEYSAESKNNNKWLKKQFFPLLRGISHKYSECVEQVQTNSRFFANFFKTFIADARVKINFLFVKQKKNGIFRIQWNLYITIYNFNSAEELRERG